MMSVHQKQACKDIVKKKVMCITSGCGFGKTVVGLTSLVILQKRKPSTTMLIVCTPEGVKKTWNVEHTKWRHTSHLNVIPLLGTPKKRLELLTARDIDAYAISYNNLQWLLDNNKGRNKVVFDYVFADEGNAVVSI